MSNSATVYMELRNVVTQISSTDLGLQQNGLSTLRNLVTSPQVAESLLANAATVKLLLAHLQSESSPQNQQAADIIAESLTNSGVNYRQALLNVIHIGGVSAIVKILQNNSFLAKPITVSLIKEMTWGAEQKNVQYVPTICQEMYDAGVVPALVQALSLTDGLDNKSKIRILKTLGTMATHCGEQVLHGEAIGAVLDYLYEGDAEGQLAAAESILIFSNVSATEVLSCGAVGPLLRLLRGHVEVQKKVLEALQVLCELGEASILQRMACEPIQDYLIICTDPDTRMLAARFLSTLTRQCRKKILRKDLVPIVMAVLDGTYNPKISSGSPRSLEEMSVATSVSNYGIPLIQAKPLVTQGSGVSASSETSAGAVPTQQQQYQQQYQKQSSYTGILQYQQQYQLQQEHLLQQQQYLQQQQSQPQQDIPVIMSSEPCYFSGKDLQLDSLDLDLGMDLDFDDQLENLFPQF